MSGRRVGSTAGERRLAIALVVAFVLAFLSTRSGAAEKRGPKECPEMTNPGGGLDWRQSDDPGPHPTSYKVELPTLSKRSPIVRVGIDKNNKMVVPKNARDVAWLDQGPIPGRTKNVVLAGHIDYSGEDGAFKRISELKKRQDVYLVLKNGKKMHFKVTFNCTFPKDTEHAEQIMGTTKIPSVTLISCGGRFNSAEGTHENRIVVRAEQYPPPKKASSSTTPKPAPKTPKPTPEPTPTPDLLERLLPPLP